MKPKVGPLYDMKHLVQGWGALLPNGTLQKIKLWRVSHVEIKKLRRTVSEGW